jgi:RNA polymerase sigma-70 factor (ECF subfamily)
MAGDDRHRDSAAGTLEEDREMVEAARRDPGRFAALYEANVDRVYAYAARRVASRAEAEDVTSETFRKALAGLPRFEWRGTPFIAWLYRIAANEIADRRETELREARTGGGSRSTPVAEAVVEPSIEHDLEEASRRSCVERSIDDLPSDQRRVVLLRFFEERSIREVARELARSEGAVKQLQLRALESLRERCHGGARGTRG